MKVGFAEIFRLQIYLPCKTVKRTSSETNRILRTSMNFFCMDNRLFIQMRAIRITLRHDFMKLLFFMVAK